MNIQLELDHAITLEEQWGTNFFNKHVKPFCDKWNIKYNNCMGSFFFIDVANDLIIDEDQAMYINGLNDEELAEIKKEDYYTETRILYNDEFRKEYLDVYDMLENNKAFNQQLFFVIPLMNGTE